MKYSNKLKNNITNKPLPNKITYIYSSKYKTINLYNMLYRKYFVERGCDFFKQYFV